MTPFLYRSKYAGLARVTLGFPRLFPFAFRVERTVSSNEWARYGVVEMYSRRVWWPADISCAYVCAVCYTWHATMCMPILVRVYESFPNCLKVQGHPSRLSSCVSFATYAENAG